MNLVNWGYLQYIFVFIYCFLCTLIVQSDSWWNFHRFCKQDWNTPEYIYFCERHFRYSHYWNCFLKKCTSFPVQNQKRQNLHLLLSLLFSSRVFFKSVLEFFQSNKFYILQISQVLEIFFDYVFIYLQCYSVQILFYLSFISDFFV